MKKVTKKKQGKSFSPILERFHACSEGMEWADDKSLDVIWRTCPHGSWLLWLCGRLKIDRKMIVSCACQCARLSLVRVKAGDDRPRIAIETTERWLSGKATIEEVGSSRYAAAATAAAYAAYAAADAAADAAVCATVAAAVAVRSRISKQTAAIVRKTVPFKLIAKAVKDLGE